MTTGNVFVYAGKPAGSVEADGLSRRSWDDQKKSGQKQHEVPP